MKPNCMKYVVAAATALTIVHSASASTLLFADNFNSGTTSGETFNDGIGSTQSGLLVEQDGAITYAVSNGGYVAQHGNGNRLLVASSGNPAYFGSVSLNYNFATIANTLDQALVFSFNIIEVSGFSDASNWVSFHLDDAQNSWTLDAYAGTIFRQSGGTGLTGVNWTAGDLVTLKLSDTTGNGSAFDGNGTVATWKIGNSAEQSFTLSQQSSAFFTFNVIQWGGFGLGVIDNLSVTAVPEPSATLLGGLGILGLLRRRRN